MAEPLEEDDILSARKSEPVIEQWTRYLFDGTQVDQKVAGRIHQYAAGSSLHFDRPESSMPLQRLRTCGKQRSDRPTHHDSTAGRPRRKEFHQPLRTWALVIIHHGQQLGTSFVGQREDAFTRGRDPRPLLDVIFGPRPADEYHSLNNRPHGRIRPIVVHHKHPSRLTRLAQGYGDCYQGAFEQLRALVGAYAHGKPDGRRSQDRLLIE